MPVDSINSSPRRLQYRHPRLGADCLALFEGTPNPSVATHPASASTYDFQAQRS